MAKINSNCKTIGGNIMKRDLKFIQSCPDDTYYVWQVHLWLESLKKIGHSDKAIVLVFTPADKIGRAHV